MKGVQIDYSIAELEWIEAHKELPRCEAYSAFCEKFGGEGVSFPNYAALCKRRGWLTGRTGRIVPGNVPPNKGMKMPFNENCARTQFKKGNLPHNTKHLGHERLNVDGYIEISIDEVNSRTGFERRYVHKHRYLWEKTNGRIPDGYVLKCLGDRVNCEPSNWELIPRAVLPRLNGRHSIAYDTAEPEIKPAILSLAKLKHAAKRRARETVA